MTIALGLIFTSLVVLAVWFAANEPSTEALVYARQVDPDQTDDESAWDLMGWHSFG